MKKNKEEEYRQSMLNYRRAYHQMSHLCIDILNSSKKQILINLLFMAVWLIDGIFLGLAFAGWWG